MRRRHAHAVALVMLLTLEAAWPAPAAAQPRPLELGVVPHLSARVLMNHYEPMRQFLQRALDRPVQSSTAPDFKTFAQRTNQGDYDVVVTAPHLARVAEVDGRHTPLLVLYPSIKGIIIVPQGSPIAAAEDLRGKTLALPNPNSLVVMRGLRWLAERNLHADRDIQTTRVANQDSLGDVLVSGGAAVAMLSDGDFRAIPDAFRAQLRVLVVFVEIPNFIVLASPRMSAPEAASVKAALLRFAQEPEGKTFLETGGLQGLKEVTPAEMKGPDAYLEHTRRVVGIVG